MKRKNKIILAGTILLLGGLVLSGCEQVITEQQNIEPKIKNEQQKTVDTTALSGGAKAITDALEKNNKTSGRPQDNKINKDKDMNKAVNENINMKFAETCEQATLKTNMGDIIIKLYGDKAPTTVANFCTLADKGFYNGIKFHRVINGFMIQAGDPQSKDDSKKNLWGTGGPNYKFKDELPKAGEYKLGSVAMANSGPNTNGSQFFIVSGSSGVSLPPLYSLFGEVTKGMDVVEKIQKVETEINDRPVSPIIIQEVKLKLKKIVSM